MYAAPRRHPLQTFRFWFFVTGAVAVTLAWRFDLLPFRLGPPSTGSRGGESFTEVDLSQSTELNEPIRRPQDTQVASNDAPFFDPTEAADEADHVSSQSTVTSSQPPAQGEPGAGRVAPSSDPFTAADQFAAQPPLPTDTSPASRADSRILQTASISDPFATREQPPVRTADQSIPGPTIDFSETDRLSQSNNPDDHIEAHRKLSQMYWQQPEAHGELRQRIDALAQRVYFMKQPHYMEAYEIQPGDRLQTIAKKYDITWQYLAKLNRVDPQRIQAGQRIKVIKGPFSAMIDLSEYEITIHAHGYFVTRYSCGIGKDGSTPLGTFTVENKQVDPTYYGPDGVIDHDDPANPLGERWIDIGNSYGIHGTIDPGSIGTSASRGCIRMHNDDAAAVYDLLSIGSEVTIRE